MVDRLVGGPHERSREWWFPSTEVAGVHRMGTAGDVDAQAVPWCEAVPSRPHKNHRAERSVRASPDGCRVEALESIAYVDRSTVRVYVAEPDEEVGVVEGRPDAQFGVDWPNNF